MNAHAKIHWGYLEENLRDGHGQCCNRRHRRHIEIHPHHSDPTRPAKNLHSERRSGKNRNRDWVDRQIHATQSESNTPLKRC